MMIGAAEFPRRETKREAADEKYSEPAGAAAAAEGTTRHGGKRRGRSVSE